jgi:hypothetical protein
VTGDAESEKTYIDRNIDGGCSTGGGGVENEECPTAEKLDGVDAAFCSGKDRVPLGEYERQQGHSKHSENGYRAAVIPAPLGSAEGEGQKVRQIDGCVERDSKPVHVRQLVEE